MGQHKHVLARCELHIPAAHTCLLLRHSLLAQRRLSLQHLACRALTQSFHRLIMVSCTCAATGRSRAPWPLRTWGSSISTPYHAAASAACLLHAAG